MMSSSSYRMACVLSGSLAFFAIGCDTAQLQSAFEDEAFSVPTGITRADEHGEVASADENDWRTSPAYMGRVYIDPAFPNPAGASDFVSIPLRVRQFNALQGRLALVSYDEDRIARRLDDIRDARDPGAYVFTFSPRVLGITGLVRLFIVDDGGGLISYGDLLVE